MFADYDWIKQYGNRLRIGYVSYNRWLLWTKWHWFIYASHNEHWSYDLQGVDFKYIQVTILGFQIGYCYSGLPKRKI